MRLHCIRLAAGLLVAAAAVLGASTTGGTAQAKEWNWPSGWGQPIHIHSARNPSFPLRNDVNENGTLQTQVEYARADWSNNGVYTQYGDHVNLYNVSSWGGQGIHVMDAHYGRTEWSGLAIGVCACDYGAGHVAYFDNLLNLTYLTDPATNLHSWESKRAIACQEIGHALAIGHGASSCMGHTYFNCPQPNGAPCTNVYNLSGRTPEAEDFAHIAHWFGERH